MADLVWSSALSPQAPSIPRKRDWSTGIAIALAMSAGAAWWYSTQDHSLPKGDEEVEERVIVALGGSAAKRIEAPPPPSDAPVVDKPPVVAERAKDAPPIAPPPEPRAVMTWTQGNGDFSSGTGGTAPVASPPPPLPPPAVPTEPQVSTFFIRLSTATYSSKIEYPPASLRAGEEGVGVLLVTIDRKGKVLKWQLVGSTDHPLLDREIERVAGLVKRLEPLPNDFPAARARFRISITFKIARDE